MNYNYLLLHFETNNLSTVKSILSTILLLIAANLSYAQSGNVGIGTSTPSTPLQVVGTVSSTSAASAASSTESTQVPPGGLELFRSTGSTASNVNGYIDFKDNSTKDFDLRLLYDHTLGTNGGFSIVTSTNGGATNAGRFTVLNSDGRIGIGTSAPDASAKLDISSTTQGVLVPRMTYAQRVAIAAPAMGLMVYQTDSNKGFWNYNGTIWSSVNNAVGNIRSVSSQTVTLLPTDQFVLCTYAGTSGGSNYGDGGIFYLPAANSVPRGYQISLRSMGCYTCYYAYIGGCAPGDHLNYRGYISPSPYSFNALITNFSTFMTLVSDGVNTWYVVAND